VYDSIPLSRLIGHSADALAAVWGGRSLNDVLPEMPADARPGVQALTFHVLRRLGGAMAVRRGLAPRDPPPRVDALLTCAIALLWPVREPPYPDHTLVDQAVTGARERTPAAAGFVNAVLRRFLRERDAWVQRAQQDASGAWNHPAWWVDLLRRDWPSQWSGLLRAADEHPPMVLRVHARRMSAADYVERLRREGLEASVWDDPALGGQAVVLARPCPVTRLPGFAEGDVSVQDANAQRAAPLLLGDGLPAPGPGAAGRHPGLPGPAVLGGALPAGARVLDACAAPGGKTAHLLERADLDVLALDSDPRRLARVDENLRRLGLRASLKAGDARQPARWWDGRPFDAILLDAPCTASGIVRRHPDVRWLRRPEDVSALAQTQAQMLQALWPLLKPGGRLLYATCSVFRAEGQAQIDAFLQRLGAGRARLDPASPGHLHPLPDNEPPFPERPRGTGDGFFYALLHKTP
jgi:16S rRNA (cytosine967-C5)-methyltransferase